MHRKTTINIAAITLLVFIVSFQNITVQCFQISRTNTPLSSSSPWKVNPSTFTRSRSSTYFNTVTKATEDDNADTSNVATKKMKEQEYRNAPTAILSNFMSQQQSGDGEDNETTETNPIDAIDFTVPKYNNDGIDLETLARILDYELYNKQWFVTGNVNPIYFAEEFEFQDPDVKLKGIEEYARGVYKLFDQKTSKAEIMSTEVNPSISPNTITVTWRLSGKVNIGPGLTIKPYICYSDFTVDEQTGLITFQEDRFDIPQWDILLSALFPFLIGKVTSAPAPEVDARDVSMPNVRALQQKSKAGKGESPLDKILQLFGGK